MNKLSALLVCTCLFFSLKTVAIEKLTFAIHPNFDKADLLQRTKPLIEQFNSIDPQLQAELLLLELPELERRLIQNQIDILLVDPGIYIWVRNQNSLTGVMATLVNRHQDAPLSSLGGVIIKRSDNDQINNLSDINGQVVGITSVNSLGGFQAQAYELLQMGLNYNEHYRLAPYENHKSVLDSVLSGKVEVGFVQTGILEYFALKDPSIASRISVVNEQDLISFPLKVSTRLYPEWPIIALPHVDPEVVRKFATMLFSIPSDNEATKLAGVSGFNIAADYLPVENVARALRIAPYDTLPAFTLYDVLSRYKYATGVFIFSVLIISLLLLTIVRRNHQLKKASDNLAASMAAKDSILTAVPDLLFEFSESGHYLQVWAHNERDLAKKENDVIGKHVSAVLPKKAAQLVLDAIDVAKRCGHSSGQQIELSTPNGDQWFELSTSKNLSNDTQPSYIMLSRNISERKIIEGQFKQSEAKYRQLHDSLPIGVIMQDANGSIVSCNPSARSIFKMIEEDLINTDYRDPRWQPYHEDGSPFPGKDHPALRALRSGKPSRNEVIGHKVGNEIRWLIMSSQPLFRFGANQPYAVISSFSDITDRRRAEAALKVSERKLVEAQFLSKMGDFTWCVKSGEVIWSEGLHRILGYSPSEQIDYSRIQTEIPHPDDRAMVEDWLNETMANKEVHLKTKEYRLVKKGGEIIDVQVSGQFEYENGEAIKLFGIVQDVSSRKTAEDKLKLAATVFSHAREGILITDSNGVIVDVNETFSTITGYEKQEAIGKSPSILRSGRHDETFFKDMWDSLLENGHWQGELWNKRKNGEIYAEQLTISAIKKDDEVSHYVALFSDVTAQKQYQRQLEHYAHHDALTELPNRLLLFDRLQQAMAHSMRTGFELAIAYIDLDGFKEVNDKYGHDVGDKFLISLANHMNRELRSGDTISRIGGDEFIVLLTDLKDDKACILLLERLLACTNTVIEIDQLQLSVSASIGVAYYHPGLNQSAEELIKNADQAMYQAKLAGKNQYRIYVSQYHEVD